MNFISCTPTLHTQPFIPPPPKKIKSKNKRQQHKRKPSHCGYCHVSHCITQYILLSTYLYLHMFTAKNHWSGSRPLASATLSILDPHQHSSWMSCCCLVSSRSWSFGSAPSCTPTVHRWDTCWDGPTHSPGSATSSPTPIAPRGALQQCPD